MRGLYKTRNPHQARPRGSIVGSLPIQTASARAMAISRPIYRAPARAISIARPSDCTLARAWRRYETHCGNARHAGAELHESIAGHSPFEPHSAVAR